MSLISHLTVQERASCDELKARLRDEVPPELRDDTFMYLRFLRAREFNFNLAENMLRNHLTWRKVNNIDKMLTDYIPQKVVAKYLPITRIGFDKEGAPVRYFAFGDMDGKGILKSIKQNDCIKGVVHCFEDDIKVMKQQTAKLGKPIEQWIYILNFEGFGFAKATHKPNTLVALFLAYEANYPERLKAAYIINASVYFTLAYAIIKPLLSGSTVKKITIFGKDGWQGVLRDTIDHNVLPAFLGGSRTDPDGNPLCKNTINHGGLVPEEYYVVKNGNRLSKQPGVKRLVVNRKSKVQVILDVAESSSSIEWEFETESKDIGFALFYKIDRNLIELVPKQRIDTHIASEVGMFRCDQPGTYIMVFDNSYSWIHQKEIYCKAAIVTPQGMKVPVVA